MKNLRTLAIASAMLTAAAIPTVASAQRYYHSYRPYRTYERPAYPVLPYYQPYYGYSNYGFSSGSGISVYLGDGYRSYGPRSYGYPYGYRSYDYRHRG